MGHILETGYGAPVSEPFNNYSNQRHALGTLLVTQDGRWFRFGKAGGTNIAIAKLCQAEAQDANLDELVVAATAVGSKTVAVTLGATAVAADDFNGGYLLIEDDAGEGYAYPIDDTPAIAASAAGSIVLTSGIEVALTAATTVSLLKHPFDDVIIHPSPNTTALNGVTASAITANRFGWFAVRGPAAVTTDGTVVVGDSVMASDNVDGTVEDLNFTEGTPNVEITPVVGQCASLSADTEQSLITLGGVLW